MSVKKITLLLTGLFVQSYGYADTQLDAPEISVTASKANDSLEAYKINTADTVKLLENEAGVSFYESGGVSSLPVIHGLNDDRIKILVDGAELTSACGNHMNPPLSYISPVGVESVDLMAGITPVSMGGDNIAGTISVKSVSPTYATGDDFLYKGSFSTFYRGNNNGLSSALSAAAANQNLSLGFIGTIDRANSYEDGHGNKVRSTQVDRRTQTFTLGLKGDAQELIVKVGHQDILHQGYVNQYMDMVGNSSTFINANYLRQFAWGDLDTKIYYQDVGHEMGFFSGEKTGTMPMNTEGKDYGYSIKATMPYAEIHNIRLGNEYHTNKLNDYWPPVAGSMMMGPSTFLNINHGHRDDFSAFAEVSSQWNKEWSTLLGIRDDYISSGTGNVASYNPNGGIMFATDNTAATAFNSQSHSKSYNNIDVTATARYESNPNQEVEFGYARKSRAPNLYELYTWGRGTMAMSMIGWFGDANGYVGNLNLKSEVANTASATFTWHDAENASWNVKLTPYFTYVQDYIDVARIGTFHPNMAMGDTKALLQFVNQDARFYGLDMKWSRQLWSDNQFGRGRVFGTLGWVKGERVNDGSDLYHIMPMNAKFTVEQKISNWTNAVETQLVESKTDVDNVRFESKTPGYALVNLRTSYDWKQVRLDLGVTNLFDKFYYLPLGGADYADWKANGSVGAMQSVAGMGRSINVGLTLKF